MSRIVDTVDTRLLAHIIKDKDGDYYFIDSDNTFDHGYETMIFKMDKDEVGGYLVDWSGVYCEWHNSAEEMAERHRWLCENFENVA